jgi:hypothetical protein
MIDLFVSVALVAAESTGPRGDNPDGSGGVLIILGIVLAVALGAFVLHALFHRFGRSRREAMTHTPAPEGRVGRVSEFRDR